MFDALREEVCAMNLELPANGLVVWSGGNVSGRDSETGCVVIKPSGVRFDRLTPESMVVVDPSGEVMEGDLKPSVDLGIHCYIYQHRPDVFGVAHTHSPYATSFAVRGEDIPAALTPLTHLIGSGVPCTRWATPAADDTGAAIIEAIGPSGLAAVVARHGVFTMGTLGVEGLGGGAARRGGGHDDPPRPAVRPRYSPARRGDRTLLRLVPGQLWPMSVRPLTQNRPGV